ncbi:MAG: hypothetical protein KKC51_06065 [Verrucomicrobia bacterium]|nr:hypothetical protein [Verrucomicrobiota bacterium]
MRGRGPAPAGTFWPCILCIGFVFCAGVPASGYVWWEGENPSSTDFPASTWIDPDGAAESNALSAGALLSASSLGTNDRVFTEYVVTLPQAAVYRLYTRKLWRFGPFRWRFDAQNWTRVGDRAQLMDWQDYKQPTILALNWVFCGTSSLSSGSHTLRVEVAAADHTNTETWLMQQAGFDAFVLTTNTFEPWGKLPPGQEFGFSEPGRWAFEARDDPYTTNALLDLSYLNEDEAGQSGFVTTHGDKFYLGDGREVRFWGVNLENPDSDMESLEAQARFLAKRGVNMVRYFESMQSDALDPASVSNVSDRLIEDAHRVVAAYKKHGIYTKICPWWVLEFMVRDHWGIAGYTNDYENPAAVPMFDEDLKAGYKSWVRELFTRTNPYTGVSLAQEPAVAIIQIQNEDGFFFWTFDPNQFPDAQRANIETMFGAFLTNKYGSITAATSYWGVLNDYLQTNWWATDNPAQERMALSSAWSMTAEATEGQDAEMRRMADQIQFLAELQRDYYAEMIDYLTNTLGCRSLTCAGNWWTADERVLQDVERHTYTVGDVIDDHNYIASVHVNSNGETIINGALNPGDHYRSATVLRTPRRLPAAYKQVAGMPSIMSESAWVNPNRFKTEAPLLVAAYSALQDIDGWMWHGDESIGYDLNPRKYPIAVPAVMGQFPGAALLYRRHDVAEAPVVVHDERTLTNMYRKEPALISEPATTDPLWVSPTNFDFDPQTGTGQVDTLAMLVGKVESGFSGNESLDFVSSNALALIDTTNGTVRSITGDLCLDWSNAICRINTERSQGLIGFLSVFADHDFDDVTIRSANEFGAILVCSLDHKPLRTSNKILVQAMTEAYPYLWTEADSVFTNEGVVYTGKQVVAEGEPPFNVVNIQATIALKGVTETSAVTVLDENGYARESRTGQVTGVGYEIQLPSNAVYTIVSRAPSAYDLWIERHFTDPLHDAEDRARAADPDGDGTVNALEFALDLDPRVGDGAVLSSLRVGADGSTVELPFTVTSNLPADFVVQGEFSTNLHIWSVVTNQAIVGTNGLAILSLEEYWRAFLRLKLNYPPDD